jgi:hypothetical protein
MPLPKNAFKIKLQGTTSITFLCLVLKHIKEKHDTGLWQ